MEFQAKKCSIELPHSTGLVMETEDDDDGYHAAVARSDANSARCRRHMSGEYSSSGEDDESAPPAPKSAPPVPKSAPPASSAPTSTARPMSAAPPMPSSKTLADLEAMKYRELQKMAKALGVKANLSTAQLVCMFLCLANPCEVFDPLG